MELRPFRAVHREPPYKERRPALWIDRQVVSHSDGSTTVVPLLIGLVRVAEKEIVLGSDGAAADAVARRVGALVSVKADAEPCLLITRAPLEAALATSRPPDEVMTDDAGVRHDLFRMPEYARHVELQGLVKNAEAVLADGIEAYDAVRQFSKAPAAAKLSGARYKLSAILDERFLKESPQLPVLACGLFGFSLEDPVI